MRCRLVGLTQLLHNYICMQKHIFVVVHIFPTNNPSACRNFLRLLKGTYMRKMKIALLACVVGSTFSAGAQTYNHIGNTTISSDGTTYNHIGNTTIGSDGSTYNRIGNTTITNDGRSYNQIGNTTIGSDGTTANRIGNTTIINGPNGMSRTCNQIGSTTICN